MSNSKLSPEAKAAVEQGNKIRKELTTPTKKAPAKKVVDDDEQEDQDGTSTASTSKATDGVLHSEQTNLTKTKD